MNKIISLREKKDFSPLFRYGKRIDSASFQMIVRHTNCSYSRVAVVASKAVSKKSTARNTLRRRIREWVRKQEYFMDHSVDVVFVAKKTAVLASRFSLYEELERAVKKI